MEESLVGFGLVLRGFLLDTQMDFADARLTVGVSNELQIARNLTSGLPAAYQGRLANLGPFRDCLTPAHKKRQNGTPEDIGVSDRKTDNGENARMQKTNMYANAMHMMT